MFWPSTCSEVMGAGAGGDPKRVALSMLSGVSVEDRTARRQTRTPSLSDPTDRPGEEVEGDSDVEETPRGGKSSNRSKEEESSI